MVSMFFGQYLLEKGIIDREALLDALERQRQTNRSLLDLAVEHGLLTPSQIDLVLLTFRSSEKSIEKTLTDDGFLTAEQVDRLRQHQSSGWLRIGDALVKGGHLTTEQVETELKTFRAEVTRVEEHLQQDLAGFPDSDILKTFFNLTAHHFSRITGKTVKLSSLERSEASIAAGYRRFAQRFVGPRCMTLAIDLTEPLSRELASGLLGIDNLRDHAAEVDAVCEFVNVVGGNACTRLEAMGLGLRPEPPIASGGDTPVEPDGLSVHAVALCEESEFDLHVFFEDGANCED